MLLANIVFGAPFYVQVIGIMAWPVTLVLMMGEILIVWLVERRNTTFRTIIVQVCLSNILSTLLGVGLFSLPGLPSGITTGPEMWSDGSPWWKIANLSVLASFILSILSEGGFYRWSRIIGRLRRPWLVATLSNAFSYCILFATTLPHWH